MPFSPLSVKKEKPRRFFSQVQAPLLHRFSYTKRLSARATAGTIEAIQYSGSARAKTQEVAMVLYFTGTGNSRHIA